MKYSIFTTANKSYYPFADILTSSVAQNCQNVDRIYVADCGLGDYRNYLKNKDKVSILDTKTVDRYEGVHSSGWVNATQQKTRMLLKILKSIDLGHPLIMIDCDVCVLKDLSETIDSQYDIQVTTMNTGGHTRGDGIFISEIASFLIINNQQIGKNFVQNWINQMKQFLEDDTPFPHETPALNLTLQKINAGHIEAKTGYLKELEVCADQELTENTLSVHFKSNGSTQDNPVVNFEKRVMSVENKTNIDLNIEQYLNEKIYDQWRDEYEIN